MDNFIVRNIFIYSIFSIPTCIDYSFPDDAPEEEGLLLFGDAAGGLTIVNFLQPLNSLFEKDEVDSVQCLFWPDMGAKYMFFVSSHSVKTRELSFAQLV